MQQRSPDRIHYKVGVNKSKAARLFIDSYYKELVDTNEDRRKRRVEIEERTKGLSKKEKREAELALQMAETEQLRNKRKKLSITDYANVKLIGRGAFGEVRVVRSKENNEVFAMKMMNKDFVIKKNQLAHARAERDAMVQHDDPGIVKLFFSFQDSKFLYFIMEYLPGGDLMNLLIKRSTLTEEECKFYMSEVILAVNAVHSHGYIHRDLKPDNILITQDGHVKLSDFGLCTSGMESHLSSFYQLVIPKDLTESSELTLERSKSSRESRQKSWNKMRREKSYSTVGTSNYMAPEILLEQGYDKEVDWWAVGVIIYECLVGYAPFSCEDAADTCLMIINWRRNLEFPSKDECDLSNEAFDLVCSLVTSQKERIGFNQIVSHPWFRGLDWENVRNTSGKTTTSSVDFFIFM
eukprot:TRINITY_DN2018_c0_g1_i15.p1 TRINITY_DN2018_c0_g1~~TRINITY_DN2018_c0_g1_i15.p1  ORF type:complete len:409 (-),score=92.35 TRINITY_DN2018_c0_g1_i15:735-1961(-)